MTRLATPSSLSNQSFAPEDFTDRPV
jgi:hypothetical protein